MQTKLFVKAILVDNFGTNSKRSRLACNQSNALLQKPILGCNTEGKSLQRCKQNVKMEVLKSNFDEQFSVIESAIKRSDFIGKHI